MAIKFECPICRNHLSAKTDYAGKEGKCKCGAAVIVPGNMEKIRFACTQCGKGISVSSRHAGKKGKCPSCGGILIVPPLGILVQTDNQAADSKQTSAANADMISFVCAMCSANIQAWQSSAGKIMECPKCGSFTEVPGKQVEKQGQVRSEIRAGSVSDPISPSSSHHVADAPCSDVPQAAAKAAVATGKISCPSCRRKLTDDAPVCTQCGIFVKSGRPILTAWDVDPDELEDKAHGIVRAVSWLIPFGVYPVYSEAMGNHKPYATWGITAVTILISIWFSVLEYSDSPKMMSAKNLMLWSNNAVPDAERIQMFYEYTSYGDAEAFAAKKAELSGKTPEDELDVAALNALTSQQRCFGEYRHFQLITYAFLHGGILHLAGNLLFLLVFGSRVNAAIGNILMVILYPILAIAAAMTYLLSMGAQPPTPMLGASGAIMGLAGAYLLLFPVHKVYMVIWMRWGLLAGFHLSFKCFAVRGFWVVLFYIMFDIAAVALVLTTGTAHWAHIGGLVWGFGIAFGLLAARIAYSRSDMLSLVLGKYAWRLIGTPANRMK